MGVYSDSGALKITVNDTSIPVGRYAADGSIRITVVSGTSYTGLYAPDGSMNVVDVTGESISTYKGLYHPSGAIRGRLAPFDSYFGFYAPDGSLYLTNFFRPIHLFLSSEQGVWYDPSDLSTLFQDSAGSTPVTAVEQPVGRILDKSGRGNHATQSTSGSRPVLSARYNRLTKTEAFDDAVWSKNGFLAFGSGSIANAIAAPNGTVTADLITEDTSDGLHRFYTSVDPIPAIDHTISIYARPNGRNWVYIYVNGGYQTAYVNISTGDVGAKVGSPNVTTSLLPDNWCRIDFTFTNIITTGYNIIINIASANGTTSYLGNGTSGVYFWGIDLRASNDGVGLPVYQRVNTSTDYDTSGFPMYLSLSTDDSLASSSIDFSGTDAVTVWAGVRKLSDAARGTVLELTASSASNNGSFHLTAPNAASATYAFESKGTSLTDAVASTSVAAPITNVLCGYSDISLDQNILRVNGVQADSDTGDQGTGNFSNAVLYIGSRGGISSPFNGRLYSLVVRGATSSSAQIAATEDWINNKIGAY